MVVHCILTTYGHIKHIALFKFSCPSRVSYPVVSPMNNIRKIQKNKRNAVKASCEAKKKNNKK